MNIDWNKDNKNKVSGIVSGAGSYEDMLRTRKEKLPEMQAAIEQGLGEWDGQNICMIVMHEDENGLPDGHRLIMTGLARPEMQMALARALDLASNEAMTAMLEAVKDNPRMLIKLTKDLLEDL